MGNYTEDEIILKKIEDNYPIININEVELNKYNGKSLRLRFSKAGFWPLEKFLSIIKEEIKKRDFRKIKEVIITIFVSKDIGTRLTIHKFQNLISGIPKNMNIYYGIYLIPKNNNKFEIFYLGKYNNDN